MSIDVFQPRGRCAAALWVMLPAAAWAAEPAPPPATLDAPHQVVRERDRDAPRLDPAIFTEISPVTASEPALRLPEDQREDD